MAYVRPNCKTKKQLRELLAQGVEVVAFQPGGIFPLTPHNGRVTIEGPHYPEPHRWYAVCEVDANFRVTRVVS